MASSYHYDFCGTESINTLLYGDPMLKAGGVAEPQIYVNTKKSGIEMLKNGSHVIKADWSTEYAGIFMPNSSLNKSGRAARKGEGNPIKRFCGKWDRLTKHPGDPFTPRFFAIPYNDAIISLGEVRVFFSNGRILDMLHTIPGVLEAPRWDVQRVSAVRTAPIENIKRVFQVSYGSRRLRDVLGCLKTISPTWTKSEIVPLGGSTA